MNMASLIRYLLPMSVLRPILRPLVRFIVGMLAIPLFRLLLRRIVRLQTLDRELEKDLEEWFRASLLLLVATVNMEHLVLVPLLEGVLPFDLQGQQAWMAVGLRLLLAMSVIEAMPDQELFSIIHPGPPQLEWPQRSQLWSYVQSIWWPWFRGIICQHINRSSPVLAIMAVIFGGAPDDPAQSTERMVGWICYCAAVTQYLIIGLVTSRDKALNALSEFDRQVAIRRRELVEEFDIDESPAAAPVPIEPSPAHTRSVAQNAAEQVERS